MIDRLTACALLFALQGCAGQALRVCMPEAEHPSWVVLGDRPDDAARLESLLQSLPDAPPWPAHRRSFWLASRDGDELILCRGRYVESDACAGSNHARLFRFRRTDAGWEYYQRELEFICVL
ncbi:MAG TPA: hypothetical protein VFL14_12745 [Xanthomonadales bacterium]|nr:hypothetical protein [Xanthomonadales bacterium]